MGILSSLADLCGIGNDDAVVRDELLNGLQTETTSDADYDEFLNEESCIEAEMEELELEENNQSVNDELEDYNFSYLETESSVNNLEALGIDILSEEEISSLSAEEALDLFNTYSSIDVDTSLPDGHMTEQIKSQVEDNLLQRYQDDMLEHDGCGHNIPVDSHGLDFDICENDDVD